MNPDSVRHGGYALTQPIQSTTTQSLALFEIKFTYGISARTPGIVLIAAPSIERAMDKVKARWDKVEIEAASKKLTIDLFVTE